MVLALGLMFPAAAAAQCTDTSSTACALPLFALPPSLGVRVQGSTVAATAALSLGTYSGPRTGRITPPWLLGLDLGLSWVLPSTVEPYARFSVSRLVRLSDALEAGLGGSLLLPNFDLTRPAGGVSGLLQVRLGAVWLRASVNFEVSLEQPLWSAALTLVPW